MTNTKQRDFNRTETKLQFFKPNKLMNKGLVLDEATWRCGGDKDENPENFRGSGPTKLLNSEGFSCCLGQFIPQLTGENNTILLRRNSTPYGYLIDREYQKLLGAECLINNDDNSTLSRTAMEINDKNSISVKTRVRILQKLFKRHGYKIKFIPIGGQKYGTGEGCKQQLAAPDGL